jgi:hypothetical protein
MTSQERKRDKNQLNLTVSPGTSAPENIRSHTHTHYINSSKGCPSITESFPLLVHKMLLSPLAQHCQEVTERDKSECNQTRQYGLQESDKALFGMRSSIICL